MLKRFSIIAACALAAAAVSVGAAVAGGGGYDRAAHPGHHKAKPGKKWKQFKQLSPSRLSRSAYLTGGAEIDDQGEDDAGDPDGKGSATFLQVDSDVVCYGFTARGIEPPTAVHIHRGEAGVNGPDVITFANVPKGADGQASGDPGASAGCKTLTDQAERDALRRIRKNPQGYYVNIHTGPDDFPQGAIRGQLAPVWYDNEG